MKNKEITIYELLGLIKDGKAPKKIEYQNAYWNFDKEENDYNDNKRYLFCDFIDKTWYITEVLNDNIEILDETYDEFEDIEEICTEKGNWWPNGANGNTTQLKRSINQLIRNQKKIIERLNNNEKG
jgi:hypothetical protein